MPTSTTPQAPSRRSSVGPAGRRGPQKAHVPYRADDLEQTKKTGIQVTYVDHKSDDFEPFDEVLQQADGKTPAKKKRKSNVKAVAVEQDEEEDMSMVTDNSGAASPGAYFSQRPHSPTPSARRVLGQSSSRPVPRGSSVDFDSVPSPKSVRPRTSGAGPSNLRRSTVAADLSADMDNDDRISRRTSFSALGGDDDDEQAEEEIDVTTPVKSKSKAKSKPRQLSPPVPASPDEQDVDMGYGDMDGGGMEDEIENGLHELDNKDSGSEEEVPVKNGKKGKGKQVEPEPEEEEEEEEDREPTPKPKKTRVKREKRIPIPDDDDENTDPSGVRRSQRHRYAPLAFWRQEKVVYGRREGGISFVPHIKEIIRVPQEEPLRRGTQSKRKRAQSNSRNKSEDADRKMRRDEDEVKVVEVWNPEEGWDDETNTSSTVLDFVTRTEVQKRIAMTARKVDPKPAANSEWFFQKVFGDGEFIAAGQLRIPPKGRKPSKGTKDNTYIFYIIEGAVNLKVHETNLVLATGAMFIIPRGNTYFIENIGERDAKLFFTQARKVPPEEDEEGTVVGPRRSSESGPPSRRASTGGPPSGGAAPAAGGGAKVKRAASTRA